MFFIRILVDWQLRCAIPDAGTMFFSAPSLLDPTSIQWAPQTWLIYLDRAWGDENVDCPMETAVAGTHMKISAPKFGVCGPSLE